VAEEVGRELGGGSLLLGAMPPQSAWLTTAPSLRRSYFDRAMTTGNA
jgi:hypothetical protein